MAITTGGIVDAIEEGCNVANRKFEEWSNGLWVTDSGVESLMVTCIAEAVNKRQERHESLAMEVSFRDIRELSKARPKLGRRPATVKDTNRADIVLFNRLERPTCVIEVKRTWNSDQCWRDLERIRDLVRTCAHVKGGSLRRGLLSMMIPKKATKAKSPDDRIDEYVGKIEELVNSHFNSKGQSVKYHLGKPSALGKRFRTSMETGNAPVFALKSRAQTNFLVPIVRPSFRDWAAECSDAPREVFELALAHVNSDRVEAAYRRTDLFDRRRVLMEQSSSFVGRSGETGEDQSR